MKSVKSRVSGYFLENTQKEWSQIRHADVFWSHSIPVRFWSWYVDFPNFGHNCDKAIGLNWDIPYVYRRTRERNDMKFGMLMYIDNLQNSSDFCCCLLIFLILVQFWLSERGFQLGFPDIRKGSNLGFLDIKGWCINLKNSMKLSMLMYMRTAFIPDWVLSWYIHIPYFGKIFTCETGQIWDFQTFFWKTHLKNGLKCVTLVHPDHFQN